MLHSMSTYASSSTNPYAREYLTKGSKSKDTCEFLTAKGYLRRPKTKKVNREKRDVGYKEHNMSSETYSFFDDNNELHSDFCDIFEHNYEFDRFNYDENENVSDENCEFIAADIEKFSIDFLGDSDNVIIDSLVLAQNDPPLYNGNLIDTHFHPVVSRRKRKQGIVGRPTLSSPKRLLVPDNVYSRDKNDEKCFTDNNHRARSPYTTRKAVRKTFVLSDCEEPFQRGTAAKSRPRILLKPSLYEYRYSTDTLYNCGAIEQDENEVSQRLVANREFARNLVARAERQGVVVDKNKIPLSVFEQEPVDRLFRSSLDHRLGGLAEIKKSEQLVSQPHTTTVNIGESRKAVAKTQDTVAQQTRMTASDILKQKWRAESRK